MKIELKTYEYSIDILPTLFIWWANDKGVSISWLFWTIEIRKK